MKKKLKSTLDSVDIAAKPFFCAFFTYVFSIIHSAAVPLSKHNEQMQHDEGKKMNCAKINAGQWDI